MISSFKKAKIQATKFNYLSKRYIKEPLKYRVLQYTNTETAGLTEAFSSGASMFKSFSLVGFFTAPSNKH